MQSPPPRQEYVLEVPSILALHRVEARLWPPFIFIAWGLITTLCATMKVKVQSLHTLQASSYARHVLF